MKINILVPTMGRKKSLQRLVESFLKRAEVPGDVHFTFVCHVGDRETIDYAMTVPHSLVAFENCEKPHLATFHNMAYGVAVPSDVYWYGGDDMECITEHWDIKVIESMDQSNGWALVAGPDGYLGNLNCPTWFFVSKRVVDAVGGFVCPYFQREGTDLVWGKIMSPLGLIDWKPNLEIQHWHATRKGGNMDETYKRLCSGPAPEYGRKVDEYIKTAQIRLQEAIKKCA